MVPGNHVVRRVGNNSGDVLVTQNLARDKTKTHALAVAEKTHRRRQLRADRRERFIAAGRRQAIRFREQHGFQFTLAAAPFGDFQTRAQLRISLVKRVREQPGQQGCAARALHELCRARQQTERQAHQRRVRKVARRDVDEKVRAAPKVTRNA